MDQQPTPDEPLPTRTEAEGATVDLPEGMGFFTTGQVLGDRYEVLELLGRGGMGEVWRAFDLKLRVEVGLKALRDELFQSERRLELLRQEVRAAREVVSPNVCRIFDLIEIDDRELVSMEYVDGATLLGVLQERGPLELKEAQDIASQFLSGLEAIHKAGLVHRDVKPENIMLTRAGRVVVMDFGLARGPESGAGSVSGTPAYMAPEHAAGGDVDARADVYSAGVVLAEMVSPEGIKSYQSRQSVWEGVRSEPAKIPDSPWAPVIKRAVARDRERRQNSAHTLIRELEDVTLRVEGADDLHPYPGLASFTEEDAEYFFGREAEVESIWRRIESAHLLAIVGPSGAGKSSFIGAGLVPNAPPGWAIVRCTPGNAAIPSLARAMAREMSGDADAVEMAVGIDDPTIAIELFSRWRQQNTEALLIIDQFEELFTLNTPDHRQRFANLLLRLALEANVRVLLSMRDDFLMECKTHEALVPVFDSLTPLMPPVGTALRRALVQPATKCGYRFEDDELVEEMLTEVEGERGSLPLLAFALALLWEKRDRETGLLTRQAFRDIGGVGGALARHAEATVDRIGVERIPIVRELFRNLVTAEGTRAVREWGELLSVFEGEGVRRSEGEKVRKSALPAVASKGLGVRGQRLSPFTATGGSGLTPHTSPSHSSPARDAAEDVLRQLIDARLLTSYEIREDEHEPIRRVEIIHESLLANWPRLVRWQTQDADAVQMREQLRQAAKTWDEHDRSDDTLWTGSAYREFAFWREHYPGGLTEIEEAFAAAMTSFAVRRRRRRRIAATAAVVVFAAVALIFAGLWRRSEEEARRAEAANLVSLGQLELEPYPSATIAYTIASLELADGSAARRLALEALWKGPTASVVNDSPSFSSEFTPDGDWLVQSVEGTGRLRVIGRDGTTMELDPPPDWDRCNIDVNPTGEILYSELFATDQDPQHLVLWSIPDGRRLAEAHYDSPSYLARLSWNGERALVLVLEGNKGSIDAVYFDGTIKRLGSPGFDFDVERWVLQTKMDLETGRWFGVIDDGSVLVIEMGEDGLSEPRVLGRHEGSGIRTAFRGLFATSNADGEIRLWDPSGILAPRILQGPPGILGLGFQDAGSVLTAVTLDGERIIRWVWSIDSEDTPFPRQIDVGLNGRAASTWDAAGERFARSGPDQATRLWSLRASSDADPLVLMRGQMGLHWQSTFHPQGNMLVTANNSGLTMWPLKREYPTVLRRHVAAVGSVVFDPAGKWLTSAGWDGAISLWPLSEVAPESGRTVFEQEDYSFDSLAVGPDSSTILVGAQTGSAFVVPVDGGPSTFLEGFLQISGVAFSSDGRHAAAAGWGDGEGTSGALYVFEVGDWDTPARFPLEGNISGKSPHFQDDDRILISGTEGLWRLDPATGDRELIYKGMAGRLSVSRGDRWVALVQWDDYSYSATGRAVLLDLEADTISILDRHGDKVWDVALDPAGEFVITADAEGVIRVGPVTGEEPHLLLGHEGRVWSVAVDPLGRWIASGGEDGTVRLWPMPDLTKPPLHTLPREELIAKLKTLTNLRVVRDPESATGWKLTHDPFPGWETVPTW